MDSGKYFQELVRCPVVQRKDMKLYYLARVVDAAFEKAKLERCSGYTHTTAASVIAGCFDNIKNPVVDVDDALDDALNLGVVPNMKALIRQVDLGIARQGLAVGDGGIKTEDDKRIAKIIGLYSIESELYIDLNKSLRSKDRARLKTVWFKYLRLLQEAVLGLRTGEEKILYRGVKDKDLVNEHPDFYGGKPGTPGFVWWGFSSCSESRDVLYQGQFVRKGATLFIIKTRQAADIQKFSTIASEQEWILPAGVPLKVVGEPELNEDGIRIVNLEDDDTQFGERSGFRGVEWITKYNVKDVKRLSSGSKL